nr:MAG TPA: hypothetical protein [Caudoviricetes sp.]
MRMLAGSINRVRPTHFELFLLLVCYSLKQAVL